MSNEKRRAADRQNLDAKNVSEIAATASVEIAAKQCDKLGAFIYLYDQKNILSVPSYSVQITVVATQAPLQMDPKLLAPFESYGNGGATSCGGVVDEKDDQVADGTDT